MSREREPTIKRRRPTVRRRMSDRQQRTPNQITLFRAAVQGVRACLEILEEEKPEWIDALCNGYLAIVKGPNAAGQLKRLRASYIAKNDLYTADPYLTAVFKALDRATSKRDAKLFVMQAVSEQLLLSRSTF